MLLESFGLVLLVSVVSAHPRFRPPRGIQWGPCTYNFPVDLPRECGRLTVPLDYTNVRDGRSIELDLVRSRATKGPFKGSVFFNPGGPGGSGVEQVANGAEQYHTILGGQFDLIGFDPRGTGRTVTTWCNRTLSEAFQDNAKDRRKRDNTGIDQVKLTDYTPEDQQLIWESFVARSESCVAEDGDIGEYLGTAFVVRDMMEIVDALGEDGKLRFWGFSYGSVLGATAAAMFPERIDRMLIDGVVNSHEWYSGLYLESGTTSDDAYNGFISNCISNPTVCPLALDFPTEESLKSAINNLINALNIEPLTQESEEGAFSLPGFALKGAIFGELYSPSRWARLSQNIADVFNGNISAFAPQPLDFDLWNPSVTLSNVPIRCSEFGLRVNSIDELLPLSDKQAEVTVFAEENYSISWQCATWQMQAKERYEGDFNVRTNHPIMLIGNTFDPVTPLVSAQNMSASFENSVLLQQNSYGHCSTSQPSVCTALAIRKYFLEGIPPEEGTICESDVQPFDTTNWKQVYDDTLETPDKRAADYSREDMQLLAAMGTLGQSMTTSRALSRGFSRGFSRGS